MQFESIKYKSSCEKSITIHGYIYTPDEIKPIAMLQICHGVKEYIGRYKEFAEFLTKHGIIVFGNDHIGHGKSAGSESELGKFCIEPSSEYLVDDVKQFSDIMSQKNPGLPMFMLGHSMGSFISRLYINKYPNILSGYIMMGSANKSIAKFGRLLASGVIAVNNKNWNKSSRMLEKLAFGANNKKIDNPKSKNSWLSRDEKIVEKYDADYLCNFELKIGGYRDLFSLIEQVSDKKWAEAVDKNLPILITAGKDDPVGGYAKEINTIYDNLVNQNIADLTLKIYDGARHEILNEINKEEVYQDIHDWIIAHIKYNK